VHSSFQTRTIGIESNFFDSQKFIRSRPDLQNGNLANTTSTLVKNQAPPHQDVLSNRILSQPEFVISAPGSNEARELLQADVLGYNLHNNSNHFRRIHQAHATTNRTRPNCFQSEQSLQIAHSPQAIGSASQPKVCRCMPIENGGLDAVLCNKLKGKIKDNSQ
jgi:hypothetical protein